MKLYYRFSEDPQRLLEVRTDYGSADGRTVAGQPYLWFSSLENGVLRTRLKVIPLYAEEACAFVEEFQEQLLEISGTIEAVERIHEFFAGCGFDVRHNKGRAWQPFKPATDPEPGLVAAPALEPETVPAAGYDQTQVLAEGGAA